MKLLLSFILFGSLQLFGAGFVNNQCVCSDGLSGGPLASSSSQAAFFGASLVSQQSNIGVLTDSSGGSVGSTIVSAGVVFNQAALNDNFATLTDRVNKIEQALQNLGLTN